MKAQERVWLGSQQKPQSRMNLLKECKLKPCRRRWHLDVDYTSSLSPTDFQFLVQFTIQEDKRSDWARRFDVMNVGYHLEAEKHSEPALQELSVIAAEESTRVRAGRRAV
jgi:hypothetical protein